LLVENKIARPTIRALLSEETGCNLVFNIKLAERPARSQTGR
jgi:hypothetical protein